MNGYQIVSESLEKNGITLSDFDGSLYDKYATSEDKRYVHFYPKLKTTHFNHTIRMNGIPVGLITLEKVSKKPIRGIPQLRLKGSGGFIHVLIFKKYRGKGILRVSIDLLAMKYGIDVLWAIIEKNNIASIKAHKKLGFEEFKQSQIDKWLGDDYINGFDWKKPLSKVILYKNY